MIQLVIILFVLVIVLIILLLWSVANIVALVRAKGVPYVPLSKGKLRGLSQRVKLNEEDKVADLGCGEGRVLRMFEKQGVKDLTGYEVNFWAYLSAIIKNRLFKSKAKIYFKNFQKINLNTFDVVFCYLLPNCINSLKEKFDNELKIGARVISYDFPMKDWHEPELMEVREEEKVIGKIYVYTIKD